MKKAAHSKRKLAHRARVGAIAAVCLVAIFAVVVCVGTIGGYFSSPSSSTSDASGSAASSTQNQTTTSNMNGFTANTEAANASAQEIESVETMTVDLVPAAPQIVVENPTFPDTDTFVTVEDEGLPPHQQSVVLVSLPEGTTRDQLQEILAEAPYVDASNVSDSDLRMGLVALSVADGVALTDAINALEHIPGVDGAQPNYVYTIADESLGTASVSSSAPPRSASTSEPAVGSPNDSPKSETNVDTDSSNASSSANTNGSASTGSSPPTASTSASSASSSSASSASDSASAAPTDEFIVTIAVAINDAYALAQNNYWQLESVNAFDAWSQLGYSAASDTNPVGIAVIDTGANTTHEDLTDRIVATYNSRNQSSDVSDSNGHGTHVAGIAAATTNNGIGVAGVSYNSNLVIIEATTGEGTGSTGGSFSTENIAKAYTWLLSDPDNNGKTVAQENNVRVINMSIESYFSGTIMDKSLTDKIDAAKSAGILTVCAAGNSPISDSHNVSHSAPYVSYPGDYASALSVINLNHSSSSTANDAAGLYHVERDSSSNYNYSTTTSSSAFTKDISAPGTGILSTVRSGDSSYGTMSGTSMASPLVAGVAALVYAAGDQAGKNLSVDDARGAIQNTAKDLGNTGWDVEYGYGEVDASASVKLILDSYVVGNTLVGTNETAGEEVYTVDNPGIGTWTWSSSDTNVATIDADTGVLTPKTAGATVISATNGVKTRTLAITVINPSITCTEATGYYSNFVCSDPTDKLAYVWGYDNVTYGVTGSGVDSSVWTYSIKGYTSSWSESVNMGASSGVLATRNVTTSKSITVVATSTSNTNIKTTKTIAIKPTPSMSGSSSIYSGLGATYSLSNTVSGDTWTWAATGTGVNITSQNASSCTIKTDAAQECTASVTATLDHTVFTYSSSNSTDITVAKPTMAGNGSIAAGGSDVYYLDVAYGIYGVSWSATISDAPVESSIATYATGTYRIGQTRYPAAQIKAISQTLGAPIKLTATITDSLGNSITCSKNITITSGSFDDLNVSISVDAQTYTGSELMPNPTVTISGTGIDDTTWTSTLTKGTDYTVSYDNNLNVGEASITITGKGSYSGTKSTTFAINPRDISTTYEYGSVDAQTYSGSQIKPSPLTLYANRSVLVFWYEYSNPLTSGTDYTVSYGANKNAGAGTIVYTGKGNYTGTKTVSFTINRAPIAAPSAKTGLTYTGKAQTGVSSGQFYSLSGTVSATGAGTYTAYATPDSNHQWSDGTYSRKTISWKIAQRALSNMTVSGSYTYTGSAIRPGVTVAASGASGSPTYSLSCSNNVNAGTAYVTVSGTGNFTGSITRSFTINRRNINEASMSVASQTHSGGALTPNPTITWNGRTLSNGSDYRVSYADNTNVGTATATATGTGNYTGSKSATFEIAAGGVSMYRLYNPNSGEHFYTASAGERDNLTGVGWSYEGVGWTAPSSSSTPVYRMYNASGGEHHYTMSAGERDMLVSVGWNYEGIGWYSDDQQRVPLYRDYNPNAFANNHNYTTSRAEHEMLMGSGWRSEGYAWYGM